MTWRYATPNLSQFNKYIVDWSLWSTTTWARLTRRYYCIFNIILCEVRACPSQWRISGYAHTVTSVFMRPDIYTARIAYSCGSYGEIGNKKTLYALSFVAFAQIYRQIKCFDVGNIIALTLGAAAASTSFSNACNPKYFFSTVEH